MKLFGTPRSRGFALLAASVAVAASACTPPSGGSAAPSPTDASSQSTPSTPAASGSGSASASASAPETATATESATPAPGATATVNALVPGFPEQLIPVMPKTSVRSSSFDKSTSLATVALVGTVKAPPEGVVDYYKTSLEAQGFKLVPGPAAVGNVTSLDFIRGDGETVNVSIRQKEGVSTFTIGANVASGSIK
ncbi:outer membrane receptor protein involved in Fe transport [Arthrobacter bambusae]|uniref:Outer membrane receptor protein involved in Fe transport n=2 Tax=Arthrobacter bambusae TaxID=1338426 RepID=A0ABV2PCE0_9MICC